MREETITIKGMIYDKRSGMPLRKERGLLTHHRPASSVHAAPQRSLTLNRRYVVNERASLPISSTPASSTSSTTVPVISKFAPRSVLAKKPSGRVISDIGPTRHPLADHAHAKQRAILQKTTQKPAIKPSQILKNEAIADALARAPRHHALSKVKPTKHQNKLRKLVSVSSASLAVLLLGGYLTYLNMPNISTRVAAAQAGIDASYPSYQPSGYSLSGPVAYDQGAVTMKFAANAGPQSYTLNQVRSDWDSSAVLENYVTPKAGKDYSTTASNGLTLYSFGTSAAWVNAGILYSISGNAPLSNEQIRHIATSL